MRTIALGLAILTAFALVVTTLLIRVELTFGTGWVFVDNLSPTDPEEFYMETVSLHGALGLFLLFATCAYISSTSHCNGALSGRFWAPLATVLAVIVGGIAVAKGIGHFIDADWHMLLFCSLNGTPHRYSLMVRLLSFDLYQDIGIAVLVLSCSSIICTNPSYRIGAVLLATITILICVGNQTLFLTGFAPQYTTLYLVPEIILLALISLTLFDPEVEDQAYLAVGVAFTVIATLFFDVLTISSVGFEIGSYMNTAENHFSQNGLAIFGFFAAFMAQYGRRTTLTFHWVHAFAIFVCMAAMYLPFAFMGATGIDSGDLTRAKAETGMQWITSASGIAMYLCLNIGILWPAYLNFRRLRKVRRYRTPSPSGQASSK